MTVGRQKNCILIFNVHHTFYYNFVSNHHGLFYHILNGIIKKK